MEIKPFAELIKLSKEKLDEAMAPVRARQVKAQAALKTSEIDAKLIEKETEVQELCTQKQINFDRLISLLDDIALLERQNKQYEDILAQLFPNEKTEV